MLTLDRYTPGRANAITHVHTDASNAEASELDPLIGVAMRRVAGQDTRARWSECFTRVEHLGALLRRGRTRHGPLQIVLVTDHMRARAHRLPDRHLAAAAADHRLGIGAELTTRTRDVDGRIRRGPEILAYGGPALVRGPHGPYHGLSGRLLEELYDTCLDDERRELSTRRARDLLLHRGVAHALSHPLDGHRLSLRGTFALISEFAFVETVNGGFFADSARALSAYVRFNNAVLQGARLPEKVLTPAARQVVEHILERGRPVHPWSGSDAHSHDLDRVVISMDAGPGRRVEDLGAGDLLAAMLHVAEGGAAALTDPGPPLFVTLGRPGTPLSQVTDIAAIIVRNALRAFRDVHNPLTMARLMQGAVTITRQELARRRRDRARRWRRIRADFDPEVLLSQLRPRPEGRRLNIVRSVA
jgi:hypothetical protein